MFYLFYNPWKIPWKIVIPFTNENKFKGVPSCGLRITPTKNIINFVISKNERPTYSDVVNIFPSSESLGYDNNGGWRFENWLADLVLSCKIGYTADSFDDEPLSSLFFSSPSYYYCTGSNNRYAIK